MKEKTIKKLKKHLTYLIKSGELKIHIDFNKLTKKKKTYKKKNKNLKKLVRLVPDNVDDDFTKKDRKLPFIG